MGTWQRWRGMSQGQLSEGGDLFWMAEGERGMVGSKGGGAAGGRAAGGALALEPAGCGWKQRDRLHCILVCMMLFAKLELGVGYIGCVYLWLCGTQVQVCAYVCMWDVDIMCV